MRFLLLTLCMGLMVVSARAEESGDVNAPTLTAQTAPVPTAQSLSEPGALANHVVESLKATGRCVLPMGVIKTDHSIDLYHVHGGVIEGVGMPTISVGRPDGFRTFDKVIKANTTIVATDESKPVFRLRACQGLELSRLGIETEGVGVSYEHVPGWPCNQLLVSRVSFFNCAIGFRAGKKPSDHNAADVNFFDCQFSRCAIGLEVNHNQGVNFLFSGRNWFGHVEQAVVLNRGGFTHLDNCSGFGVGAWLTVLGGGPNLMPCRITHLYSDRVPEDTPPVIVDATDATDQVRVIVDGVKVTQQGLHDRLHYSGHVYYRLPRDYKRTKSAIRVRDNDLNNYPWGGVYEPQVVEE